MVELTGATRNQLREERFLASEASSFGERFWRAKRAASENDFGERSESLGERFWRAKRGIQYTQKIFGKRSEPLGEQFWRVKRSVIFPPNLGGKPPSFYFSKNPPTCWGVFYLYKISKITLAFFCKNTHKLAGGFFTFKK